jgi:hypothetical protein
MTKQHFEWAASYIRAERERNHADHRDDHSDEMQRFATALFAHFGARFDAFRFGKACRGEDFVQVSNPYTAESRIRTVKYGKTV